NGKNSDMVLKEDSIESDYIMEINLDINAVNVNFKQGEEYKVEYGFYEDSKYTVEVNEGVINVSHNSSSSSVKNINSRQYINIIYPEDALFNRCSIHCTASNLSFDKMKTKENNMNLNASKVKVSDSEFDNIDIKANACMITMDLIGNIEEYGYRLNSNDSVCTINGKSFAEYSTSDEKERMISFEVNAGKVKVSFNK
ncbi:MAG: DUF4097 family beta strand repeat-containing protein, partial [Lachnospiraceae bacterium]|nr:DUF4097 family beta strand repeat-containing protein [Lachnospiraceae bacterium]